MREGDVESALPGSATTRAVVGSERALFKKLRPGPGRSRAQVVANQRLRLAGAMVELVTRSSYDAVTVRELTRLAGVSTKAFYACFASLEECLADTCNRIIQDVLQTRADPSLTAEDRMQSQLSRLFSAPPQSQRSSPVALIDALSTGPNPVVRERMMHRAFERIIGDGLISRHGLASVPKGMIQGAAAAAVHVARCDNLDAASVPAEFLEWLEAVMDASDHVRMIRFHSRCLEDPQPRSPGPTATGDRQLFVNGAIRLSADPGYSTLTVRKICREAGLPQRRFDRFFKGLDDCFLEASARQIRDLLRRAESHGAEAGAWELGVVRTTSFLCAELDRESALARLAYVDILGPGLPGVQLRQQIMSRLAARFCRTAPSSIRPGMVAANASVAAAATLMRPRRQQCPGQTAVEVALSLLAPAMGTERAWGAIRLELETTTDREVGKHRKYLP